MQGRGWWWVWAWCLAAEGVCSGRVLVVSLTPSPSHTMWFANLVDLLLENGHQVEVLDTSDGNKYLTGRKAKYWVLEGAFEYGVDLKDLDKVPGDEWWGLGAVNLLADGVAASCGHSLRSPTAAAFLAAHPRGSTPFDLIINDACSCGATLGLVHRFGYPPLLQITPYVDPVGPLTSFGVYQNPSYVPHALLPYVPPMSLGERLHNGLLAAYDLWVHRWRTVPGQERLMREVLGPGPPLGHLAALARGLLLGPHPALDGPRTLPGDVALVPALHIQPPKPLPQAVREFLDGAKDGAIFFSLGTNIQSADMTPAKLRMFLDVFSSIPQRVLWKFEAEGLDDKPDNVMISKWLPQNDILGHKNVRLFISHGGLLGSQEAAYHGVPVLGVPFFLDQQANVGRLVRRGLALPLRYSHINPHTLNTSIHQLLHTKSYRDKMREMAAAFRGSPERSRRTLLEWVEGLLGGGHRPHLRLPTTRMPIHQIMLLDITAIVLFILCTSFICLYYSMKFVLKLCFKKKVEKKKSE